jgi:hypothetical protein
MRGQHHVPAALPTIPLGGPQSPSESYGERKNLLPLLGIEPCPVCSIVAIPTKLSISGAVGKCKFYLMLSQVVGARIAQSV